MRVPRLCHPAPLHQPLHTRSWPQLSDYACSDLSFDGAGPPPLAATDMGLLEGRNEAPRLVARTADRDDKSVPVAKCASSSAAGSIAIQIEEARDFSRKQCHKYTAIRPAVSGQWSFETRQVTGSPAGSVKVHWVSSKTESAAADGPLPDAATAAEASGDATHDDAARRDGEEANGAGGAVAAKAVHSRVNMLASTSPAAARNNATTATAEALAGAQSGSSIFEPRPKESLGDVNIRVRATGHQSSEGKEEFEVGVASSRSRASIHLEGQILTATSSKADLVHDFKMAAVGNPHWVRDVAPPSEERDTNCPPHMGPLPSTAATAKTEQGGDDVKSQPSAWATAKTEQGGDDVKSQPSPAATAKTEQGGHHVKSQAPAPAEPPAPESQPADRVPPLQKNVECERVAGRETFRAAVVPEANVPSLGCLTKVLSVARNDQDGGLASQYGLGDNQTGGPILRQLSVDESDEPAGTAVASSRSRRLGEAKTVRYAASSERLDRISRASARSGLREEFLFSATTVGFSEKERQALPPVRESVMSSSSRVHLRPTSRFSEFGLSATTFGLTEKDRRTIAPSHSLDKRRSGNRLSRDRTRSTSRLDEFGFSATTIGLTDKDRRAIASSQSLDKRSSINRSKRSQPDFKSSSKKSLHDCIGPSHEVRREFGFSATTIGLTDRDVQNLPSSRDRFRASETAVLQEASANDASRQSSRTAYGFAERRSGEFLPVRSISHLVPRSSRSSVLLPPSTMEGLIIQNLPQNENGGSSRCVFVGDLDTESNAAGISKLNVSSEMLQSTTRPLLSVIDEEESTTDIDIDGIVLRRNARRTLKVTPPRELFGSIEGSRSFDNSNPATYNSSNQPGQPIGSFYEERLQDPLNLVGSSFESPRNRASTVRFLENTAVSHWVPVAAQNPSSVEFQGHRGQSATTIPSAHSMMDFETAYETAHNSSEAQSPLPALAMSRLGAVSVSSSSSLEADGVHVNQAAQFYTKSETSAGPASALGIPAPNGILRNTGDALGSNFGNKHFARTAAIGSQLYFNEDNSNFLADQQNPSGPNGSTAAPGTGSAEQVLGPPYRGQFGYHAGADDWLPYGRYCEPPVYQELGATTCGAFQASFTAPKPPLRVPYPINPGVEAIVAPATGGVPRTPLVRRRSPEFARGQLPYGRLRLSTAGATRKSRRVEDVYRQHDVPYVGPRTAVSAQQNVRVGQAYGSRSRPRARRSVSPARRMTHAFQQRPYTPANLQGQYWGNTYVPSVANSWHGGCYENPAFEPVPAPFLDTMPASPTSEATGWWIPDQEYRRRRKKAVLRVESVSTFESHENANEPRAPSVRSPAVYRKRSSQEKITSAKTVQTEERGDSARCVAPTTRETGRPKVITPRVKTHVDIDDSNSETRNASYTRVRTQTETVQQPWAPGGGPPDHARNVEASFLSPNFGTSPSYPGYVNQNFVCPPYMPNFRPELAAPTAVPVSATAFLGQTAQMTPPAAFQMAYYGQMPAISPPQSVGPPASPPAARAQSSSERATACPLSSCFKGAFSRPEESSEQQPKKRDSHCCHRERRRKRARSPLPPPSVGSTFTVGYVMNSENELSPVLMPLNATSTQSPPNETRGTQSVAPSAHAVSSLESESEEDPVAKLEKRVQEQMVEIEKAIQEQDARWEQNEMRKRKETERKKPPKEKTGSGAKRRDGKLRNIFVAKVEDSYSPDECDAEPRSWFSWSRTSKSRKGVQLRVPREARPVSSMDTHTEGSSASRASSKGNLSEGSEKIAIPGVSSSEAVPSGFTWATRRKKHTRSSRCGSPGSEAAPAGFACVTRGKKPSQYSSRGSPDREPMSPDATLETRRKKATQPSPRGSPNREAGPEPGFAREAHQNKSSQPSPRGSLARKVFYMDDDISRNDKRSGGGSPPRASAKTAPSSKHSGRSSPLTDRRQRRHHSEERSTPSPDIVLSGAEADTDTDSALLAKIRVGFPGARRTQRRWSRTEMHRSTSYDTAASSLAPSSTAERRARSAGRLPGEKSRKPSRDTVSEVPPSSCWQSVCNLFGGPEEQPSSEKVARARKSKSCCSSVCDLCRSWCDESPRPYKKSSHRRRSPDVVAPLPPPPPVMPPPPIGYPPLPPKPKFRRRNSSYEDVAEKSQEEEAKPASGGSILSNICNWFSSRSGDKQDEGQMGRKDTRLDNQGSSFQVWLAKKERALKRDEYKLRGPHGLSATQSSASQSREHSATRSREPPPVQASPMPQELYFEEEGGPRWVIKYSPSNSASPAQLAVDGHGAAGQRKSASSRERTPPVLSVQQSPAGAAETNWSVQYLYGPSGSKQATAAQLISRPATRMPTPPSVAVGLQGSCGPPGAGQGQAMAAGFGRPPSHGFNNTPDWSIRITQGREHSSSSRVSVRSKDPGKHSPSTGSKEAPPEMQPSFVLRLLEPRPRSRGSSAKSLEHTPDKKKSEVSFKDKPETNAVAPPAEPAGAKSEKTEPPPPPAADAGKAHPAPPVVAPRVLHTEESFKHEFYEEMDERGRAATMAPAVIRPGGGSAQEAAQTAALQMAAFDALLSRGAVPLKTPEGATEAPKKPSSGSAPSKEEKKLPETPMETSPEKQGQGGASALLQSSQSEPARNKAKGPEAPKPGGRKASLSPGEPAHTNYVLEMKRQREPYWSDPLSYKCPSVQEVAGYAIITAVLLLGLVLLVSVPRMRSQDVGAY
ncbi:uncharacterized protein [Dermacentor albipictus]|uniref:uncharacterized protein isoform X2 n=1 Tax=Dermacentor albipictus TaxID=60249 RepID=UPI0038FBFEC8